MKTLSAWRYGTEAEKRLLERYRNIMPAIEPGAEIISYDSDLRRTRGRTGRDQVQKQVYKTTY